MLFMVHLLSFVRLTFLSMYQLAATFDRTGLPIVILLFEFDLFKPPLPIWSTELKLGLKAEEADMLEGGCMVELIGGLDVYRPEVTELCFSFNCLLNHWMSCALLSKLLMDSSNFVPSTLLTFYDSVNLFSSCDLSIFSSLITLFLSVISFILVCIWDSCF